MGKCVFCGASAGWFRNIHEVCREIQDNQKQNHYQDPSSPDCGTVRVLEPKPSSPRKPHVVTGRLTHRKTYFPYEPKECQLCGATYIIFSRAIDASGKEHICCVVCLERLGGIQQLELAAKENYRIDDTVQSIRALAVLRSMFPDPNRRPYGEVTLVDAITIGGVDPARIIEKINSKSWTEYDVAKIEGRPAPEKRSKNVKRRFENE